MKTYYLIEYTNRLDRSSNRLAAVETLEDTRLYIKEHHLMTKRIYKKWYPNLYWTPKRNEYDSEVPISEKYDTFKRNDGKSVLPTKCYITRFWYSEPMLDNEYILSGYEDYEVFEIVEK